MAPIIETDPVGGPPQDPFLNTVIELATTLPPRELLKESRRIEGELGRPSARGRNEPRILDIDILFYGDIIVSEPELEIPHPRLHERAFVLQPLVELAPALRHPVLNRTAAELLADLQTHAA